MSEAGAENDEARHPIGVVADRTGLSVHQLRAWERRYGAVEPSRTEGNHRLYSDADVRRLGILSELTERGGRIGQLAGRPTEELVSLLERQGRDGGAAPPSGDGDELAACRRRALDAVEAYDVDRLESLVRRASLKHGLATFVDELVVPVLTEVGTRWHDGDLGIAQEHIASGVFTRVLQHILEGAASEREGPALLVATPAGHRHEIGAMIAAAVAATEGWRVLYLGADLPAAEIARTAGEVDARAVALSVVYGPDEGSVGEELRRLRGRLPRSVKLLVGGRGASRVAAGGAAAAGEGLEIVTEFGEFGKRLRQLERAGSGRTTGGASRDRGGSDG
jgi:DNA-binding transcriptional MerR regulator